MIKIFGLEEFNIDLTNVYNEVARIFRLPKSVVVNLNFISEQEIRELNKETRGIDKITDVLTYPYILRINNTIHQYSYNNTHNEDLSECRGLHY